MDLLSVGGTQSHGTCQPFAGQRACTWRTGPWSVTENEWIVTLRIISMTCAAMTSTDPSVIVNGHACGVSANPNVQSPITRTFNFWWCIRSGSSFAGTASSCGPKHPPSTTCGVSCRNEVSAFVTAQMVALLESTLNVRSKCGRSPTLVSQTPASTGRRCTSVRNNSCCLRVTFSTCLYGFFVYQRFVVATFMTTMGGPFRDKVCSFVLYVLGPLCSASVQTAVIQSDLDERVWQQPSLIDNSRPRVWNARTRCKKRRLDISWNAFVTAMWCEPVCQ